MVDSVNRKDFEDITDKQFGYWTVLNRTHSGKWLCQCICGTIREVYKKSLINGRSKSCGCKLVENQKITLNNKIHNKYDKYIGQGFGELKVDSLASNISFNCTCSCGNKRVEYISAVLNGKVKSCGCKAFEYSKQTALERYGDTIVSKANSPREIWQIDAVKDKDSLSSFINKRFLAKPTLNELSKTLGITNFHTAKLLKQYKIVDAIEIRPPVSEYEYEITRFIKDIYSGVVVNNTREIIVHNELDIYIPDKGLAIEINGDYWHSSLFKDTRYHINKTIECSKQSVNLIHVFEYELKDSIKKDIVKSIISSKLGIYSNVIYARNTKISVINDKEIIKDFLNNNHLQGYINSSIAIGLEYNNELVDIMTFGTPRFNNNYQYEIIRSCSKINTHVVGGFSKIFKSFIRLYNPESVISYVDLAKFNGQSYKEDFKLAAFTTPNYVWVKNNIVLSRYQTQKQRLLDKGLGTKEQTEDDIMSNLGYYKVFDCGNAKYIWNSKEEH